jgi:hypothetical protein
MPEKYSDTCPTNDTPCETRGFTIRKIGEAGTMGAEYREHFKGLPWREKVILFMSFQSPGVVEKGFEKYRKNLVQAITSPPVRTCSPEMCGFSATLNRQIGNACMVQGLTVEYPSVSDQPAPVTEEPDR